MDRRAIIEAMSPHPVHTVKAAPTISLVGLPGSGKSTLGKHLARRLGLRFMDSDREIEQEIGCSIKDYFEHQGEAAFRQIETAVLRQLCLRRGLVVATGGGAVLAASNRESLKLHTICVYLATTPEQLMRRLRGDQKRPLLQVQDPYARLCTLFEQRDPLYREVAQLVVETGRPSVKTVVNKIAMQLEMTDPHFMTWDYANTAFAQEE